ncbi:hypothetical protein AVEN_4949-1 [Araneus ventricosus]|uniref:Uncharacterized protein n=1 Tax=Araneus ventricosus TaxID=182803 RepID=A0A4Y2E634_ARAVE|nr:hypothetical protein AVEN_4949-1 [Araneus ventricosus]
MISYELKLNEISYVQKTRTQSTVAAELHIFTSLEVFFGAGVFFEHPVWMSERQQVLLRSARGAAGMTWAAVSLAPQSRPSRIRLVLQTTLQLYKQNREKKKHSRNRRLQFSEKEKRVHGIRVPTSCSRISSIQHMLS